MLGIYCRISKDRENQKSIQEQTLLGKEFAAKYNYQYKLFIDRGISGGNSLGTRPAFDDLLKGINNDSITAIYVYNQDRAERNEATWFYLADLIIEKNIQYFENGNLIDLKDPNSFMLSGFKTIMNANFKRTTSRRIVEVLDRKVSLGEYRGGIKAFGYTVKNKELVIHEEEAQTVKKIFELSLKGNGYNKIAKYLNDNGVKTRYAQMDGTYLHKNKYTEEVTVFDKKDSKWAGGTITGIIKNTIYYGKKKHRNTYVDVPPLFTKDYWDEVNGNLADNRNNSGANVRHNYLLKGLLRCGKCGNNYYGRKRLNLKDNYYQCSSKRTNSCGNRSINIDRLEEYIWHQLFINDGIIEELKNEYKDTDTSIRIEQLQRESSQLSSKKNSIKSNIDKVLNLIIEGNIDETLLVEKLNNYRKEQIKIETEITNLNTNLNQLRNSKEIIEEYSSEFKRLTHTTDFEQKKNVVNRFVKNIVILTKDKFYYLKIEFKINVPPRIGIFTQKLGFLMPSSQDHHYLEEFNKDVTTNRLTSDIV